MELYLKMELLQKNTKNLIQEFYPVLGFTFLILFAASTGYANLAITES
jgi:hypothetical protein